MDPCRDCERCCGAVGAAGAADADAAGDRSAAAAVAAAVAAVVAAGAGVTPAVGSARTRIETRCPSSAPRYSRAPTYLVDRQKLGIDIRTM